MLKRIAALGKDFSNGCYPLPVAWGVLECGHTCRLEKAANFDYARGHDASSYLTKVGDVAECSSCNHYAEALARLRAMTPGAVQHARFRPRDSRGNGAGDYYVYESDPRSPTGVRLLLSLEATPEADAVLCALQASPLSPAEAR